MKGFRILIILVSFLIVSSIMPGAFSQNSLPSNPVTIRLPALTDTYVNPLQPELNFGGSSFLRVDARYNITTYMSFNISKLTNSTVHWAKLYLYLQSKDSEATPNVAVYTVSQPWEELRVTSLNAPPLGNLLYFNDTLGFVNTWYYWDITDDVLSNLPNGLISLAARALLPVTGQEVFASMQGSQAYRPYLEVSYTPEETPQVEPPVIGSVSHSPDRPTSEDEVAVFAEVSVSSVPVNVTLTYQSNSTSWKTILMGRQGVSYSVSIPRQEAGNIVEYFILAVDTIGNSAKSPVYQYSVDKPLYYYEMVSEYNSTINDLNSRISELVLKIDSTIAEATRALQEADSRYQVLKNQFDDLRLAHESLLKNYTVASKESEDLRLGLKNVEELLSSAQAELNRYENKLTALTSQLEGEISQNIDMRQRLDNLNLLYSEATSQINDLQTQSGLYQNTTILFVVTTATVIIATIAMGIRRRRQTKA
jgi:hypothetical protein